MSSVNFRLQSRFAELKEQNRAALVTFVTAGAVSYTHLTLPTIYSV